MNALAIDPGLKGGAALIADDGRILATWRMPALGTRSRPTGYDAAGIARIVGDVATQGLFSAWTEAPTKVRGDGWRAHSGISQCTGIWRGVLGVYSVELHEVVPRTWQSAIGLRAFGAATKDAALGYARQRWPGHDWTAATDGEVDACLVAAFGLGQERVMAMGGRR